MLSVANQGTQEALIAEQQLYPNPTIQAGSLYPCVNAARKHPRYRQPASWRVTLPAAGNRSTLLFEGGNGAPMQPPPWPYRAWEAHLTQQR